MKRPAGYIPSLDGLRAIAVLGVLVSHLALTHTDLDWVFFGLPWGRLGVHLFFVLSGFLITRILLAQKDSVDAGTQSTLSAMKVFYLRRFLRIFPIFYLTIAIACILNVGNMRDVAPFHALYLSNFESVLFENFHSVLLVLRDPTSAHFWSLAVEEQFYLIWPTIVLCAGLSSLRRLTIGLIVFAVLWRAAWLIFVPKLPSSALFACLDSIGFGALLSIDQRTEIERPAWLGFWFVAGAGALFIACCAASMAGVLWRPNQVLFDLSSSALFALLIFHATLRHRGLFWRTLESGPLTYLGKISYGIYIYHAFMSPFEKWILREFDLPDLPQHTVLPALVTVFMTVAVAAASWHFFERPLLSLKSMVSQGRTAALRY